MYDDIFYCEEHDVKFNMVNMPRHIDCRPECVTTINFTWSEIFNKCLNAKTGPSFIDVEEGKYTDKWLDNENNKMKLLDDINKEVENANK